MALSEKLRACAERLANRPGDPEAVAVLEGLLDAPAEAVQAAQFLAPAYERAGNDAGLERVLGLVAAQAEAPVERLKALEALVRLHQRREAWRPFADATEKLAWVQPDLDRQRETWRSAAQTYTVKLGDRGRALEAWLRLLLLDPTDGEGRAALRVLTTPDMQVTGAVAALCTELVAKSKGHAEAQAVLDRLLPPTEALLQALKRLQESAEPATLLEGVYRAAQRADAVDEVADAVQELSETLESPAQVTALLRFAARMREELKQPQKAAQLWNDLLAGAPRDPEALEHLARLLAETGDTRHAGELSVRRAELAAQGSVRLTHFAQAADYFIVAGAHEAALSALNEALRVVGPASDAALLARVQLQRGKLLERAGDPSAVGAFAAAVDDPLTGADAAAGLEHAMGKPLTRVAAAKALEQTARRQGDPKRLAAVLAVRAEGAASTEQHLELLVELSQLYQQLAEPRAALGALIRAFALSPSDERVGPSLERFAYALGANEELLAAYEEHLERRPSDAAVARKAAQLHESLGNRDEAYAAYERAAEAAPKDLQLLEAFAERARARGDLARLARALRWQADATMDPAAKAKLLRSLAHLKEDSLADPAAAAHAWEEVRELEPGDAQVLTTLVRLYEQTNHVAALSRVVARQLELARASGQGVAALALKLARLKLDAPTDEVGALSLLREVLKLEPDNAQAVAALGRLASTPSALQAEAAELAGTALDKLGDYPVVVQILEAQLATTTGAAQRAAILHRISDLQAGPLKDPDLAFLAIARALREAPHDAGVLSRCIELAEATGSVDELEALLAELGAAQPSGAARAGLFRALAGRSKGDAAIAAWSEVLAQVPDDAAARDELAKLFESAGRLVDLAVLQRQRAESASPAERPAALLALAAAQERAGEIDEAASTLLGLFALKPGVEALAPLDRVLKQLGRHSERAEVLRRLAAETADEKLKVTRMIAQARALLAAKEPAQAVTVLGDVLSLSPDEPRSVAELVTLVHDEGAGERAAELLVGVFKAKGMERQRAAVLEALVVSPGARDPREMLHELCGLHETLGDFRQGYAGALRLVREGSSDREARERVERLAGKAGLEEELVEAYDELLEGNVDMTAGLAMRETIAKLYQGPLHRPELAVRAWEKVAKLDRAAVAPLEALRALHEVARDWVKLGAVLQKLWPMKSTAADQLVVLRKLAELADGPLHDKGLAAETYKQILERAPGDSVALRALGGLLDGFGKHDDAYSVLARQLEVAATDDEKAALSLKLGQLAVGPLGKPKEAVEHFARATGRDEAVRALELLMSREAALKPRIAQALEPVYRARNETHALADVLELQPPAPARLEELATLREGLKQPPKAFVARQQLFALAPEDERLRSDLVRVAGLSGQLETVASMFHARLEHRLAEPERLSLLQELGSLHERLGRRLPAAQVFEELAKLKPQDVGPLEKLCELYRAESQWPKLPALLRMRAELASDVEQQVALLLELAEVAEQKLGDSAAAVEASRAAVERGGLQGPALPNLERLLEKSGRWAELRELLLQRAGDVDLQVRIALVEHRALRDDDAALARVKAVLGRDDTAAGALLEMMRSDRPSAAAAAKVVETSLGQEQLVESLEVQAEWASGEARSELLHRVADLHGSDAIRAFDALDRLLRDAPGDVRALERLTGLASESKFERGLARLLGDVAPKAPVETQRTMWPQLAQLRAGTADPEGALEAWHAMLQLEPKNVGALVAASELVEAAGKWAELVGLLERRAALNPAERPALLARAGAVQADRMKDAAAAYETYRRLLELEPKAAAALERLDALCTKLERWPELAEVLGRRIALGGETAGLKLRLARVRRSQLANAAGALPLLGELLQDDPTQEEALAELKSLSDEQPGWEPAEDLLLNTYRRSKDFVHLAVLLDAVATRALKGGKRRALWLELADLRLSVDQDPQLSFLAMARAFRESPGDAALRERLSELAATAKEEESFGALLDEVMPQLKGREEAEGCLTLGRLCLDSLDEAERSVTLFRRARELESTLTARALVGLDEALTKLERWDELLQVLEERLTAAAGDVALLLRIGAVAADRLGRDERAIEAYRAVLGREAKHLDAARALEVLYERTGHRSALLDVLTLLESLLTGVQRAQVRMKMARLCVKDDYERTLALCRKLLEEDPLHAEAFTLLAERLESGGRWAELDQVLEARLSVTLSPGEAAELGFRLGELAFRKRDDPKKAVRHYRGVLERAPRHLGALEALEELYEGSGERVELARVLAAMATVREEPELRRAHHLRRAEVLAELSEREPAAGAVRAALEGLSSGSLELSSLERLRAVTLKLDALPEASKALGLLAAALEQTGKAPKAVATLFELADVDERRGEPAGATAALEHVLVLEPSSRQAYDRARKLYASQPKPWATLTARFLPNLKGDELLAALDALASTHAGALKDAAGAFGFASQAVRLDPASEPRRATAEQLAKGLKKLDALAAVYRETLSGLAWSPAFAALALALARLEDEGLGQVDAAEATLKSVLAHDPVNPAALNAMSAMFERRNLHAREAESLELKLEATSETPARLQLLERLAVLHEQRLKDSAAAAHALRRLVDASPEPSTARKLVDLHLRHQQWAEALNALLRLRTLTPAGSPRAAVQLEIAQLHEQQLNDLEAAVEAYLQTLELDPLSSNAFRSLERLYVKLDRPAELLRAYEQRISATSSTEEKIELEYKSAALWEKRGNPQAADKSLSAVVAMKADAIEALEGLQRLRRAASRWRPLAEALLKHAEVAAQPLQRAQLYTELGTIELDPLKESAAAAKAWSAALEQVPDHRPALKLLAALHEKERRFADAAALLEREAKLETQAPARAALEHHRGELLQDELKNLTAARAAYQAALKSERLYLPALRRLRGIHFDAGEWDEYEKSLAFEAKSAPQPPDRYSAGLTLAQHHLKRQKAPEKAVPWFEHAFAVSPGSLEAALPLADLLVQAKSWERAVEVLKAAVALLEKEEPKRPRELIDRLTALANAHRELMQPTLALHAFAKALHLDPTEPNVLRAQAEMLQGGGHIAEASEKLELFLEHHGQTLMRGERAQMSMHLAEVYWKLKREKDALLAVERTLDLEPSNTAALALGAKAADKLEAHDKAVQLKQRLADVSADDARYKLLVELAAQAHQKLSNPLRAVEALLQAQKLKAQSREVWQALAAAYGSLGHNRKAAEAMQALLQHPESTPADKRKDTLQLADLYGRAMGEVDRASDVLERSLDEAPQFVEAFQALEGMLSRAKDWKKLDGVYSRHAVRLGKDPDSAAQRAALWRGTGELRLKQFKDRAGALAAFEQGMRLVPDDAAALEAFAGLAIEFPDRVNDALQAYLRALPKSPDPQRACAAFARIAERRGDLDSASIATRASSMLSSSGTMGAVAPPKFRAPVEERAWREWLLHPLARGPLGELLALIWENAGERYAPGLSDYKLHAKKHAVDPRTATHESLQHLSGVAKALGFPALELLSPYLAPQSSRVREAHPDDAVAVKVVPSWPPRVVVGERLMSEKHLPSLYALVGRGLASLRPEILPTLLLDGDALELVVEAALSLGEPGYVSPYDPKMLKADRKQLDKSFSGEAKTQLGVVVEKLLPSYRPGAVARFREGARLTPLRAALLVAGDFAPVRAQIAFEGEHADAAVRELLVFALGGELHQLRVATGTQVEAK